MPSANVYSNDDSIFQKLEAILPEFRSFLAQRLSCGDRALQPEEISLRFIKLAGGVTISSLEIEISAYSYPQRVKEQDLICRDVVSFIQESDSSLGDIHVWLVLSELGHSWEE